MNKFKEFILIICLYVSIVLFLFTVNTVHAETVIYENITQSQYKFITLEEIGNIPFTDNYKYKVVMDGKFIGYYGKNDNIYVPDNSTLIINIPSPIVKTDISDVWGDYIKPQALTFIGFITTWGFGTLILIVIIGYVGYRVQRKIRKGY